MSINRVNISGNLTRDPELRATAVSYTHLDVYKRQLRTRPSRWLRPMAMSGWTARSSSRVRRPLQPWLSPVVTLRPLRSSQMCIRDSPHAEYARSVGDEV